MPICNVVHNQRAQSMAQDAIVRVLSAFQESWETVSDGRGILGMLPIYSFPAARLAANQWNKGWRSGWRYYWTHPSLDWGITVDIHARRRRYIDLGAIGIGTFAVSQWNIVQEMRAKHESSHRRYRPRFLRLPWIQLEAIWLNTNSLRVPDLFTNLSGTQRNEEFRGNAISRAQDFISRKGFAP